MDEEAGEDGGEDAGEERGEDLEGGMGGAGELDLLEAGGFSFEAGENGKGMENGG